MGQASSAFFAALEEAPGHVAAHLLRLLFAPQSHFSLLSLVAALGFAALFLILRRKRRDIRARVLFRALFPRSLFRAASCRTDASMMLFNVLIAGALFGGMLLSTSFVAGAATKWLDATFGVQATALPPAAIALAATLSLYLAYEFAYWLDHYLKHRFAILWAFHAVHHSAERLTPLTNFRVHPVDTILFYNLVALLTGATQGALTHLFGAGHEWTVGGANLFVIASVFIVLHLQHSELWITFRGRWSRIFLSPAHHQVHHSADPVHFNRNFGASLALFDHLFGTLHVPSAKREVTRFGLGPQRINPHGFAAMLVTPVVEAAAYAVKAVRLPNRRGGFTVRGSWRQHLRLTNSGV